jgi:hypothetical protein
LRDFGSVAVSLLARSNQYRDLAQNTLKKEKARFGF